jgi:hypothetical protein
MKDMLGQELNPGDYFLIPGGNVRYGGLVLEVGVILAMTEKRLKTLITRFDKIKLKPTTKTSTKVFKLPTNSTFVKSNTTKDHFFFGNPAIIALQEAYIKYEDINGT